MKDQITTICVIQYRKVFCTTKQLRQDQQVSPDLLLKDPYILDFLDLHDRYLEKDLEDAILRDIEKFLLEMGAGFTFVARQKHLQIDDDDFYIDLLFYNRKLKRLVAIDLKIGNFRHEYKSQMELYLRWLAKYEQESDEQPPLASFFVPIKSKNRLNCKKRFPQLAYDCHTNPKNEAAFKKISSIERQDFLA